MGVLSGPASSYFSKSFTKTGAHNNTQTHTRAHEHTLNREANIPISVWKKKNKTLLIVENMELVQIAKWTWGIKVRQGL